MIGAGGVIRVARQSSGLGCIGIAYTSWLSWDIHLICSHRFYETPFKWVSCHVLAISECMKVEKGEIHMQGSKKVTGKVSKKSRGALTSLLSG